jgi:DUF4097 and DUF4098 domain-containing protein YvlB
MNRKPLTQPLAAALAVAVIAALSPNPVLAAERQEHKQLPAGGGGTLTFKAVVGSIEIKTHDRNLVIYDAVLKPGGGSLEPGTALVEDMMFDYETSGDDVTITMKWKENKSPRNIKLSARHTLSIPLHYNLDVRTAGGKISGDDINGKVAANTSGGSIRFGKVNGEINARTSGGGITVADVQGNVEVKTDGGSIHVGNVDGNVAANTSGGGITLRTVTGEVKGDTSGGSITAELAGQIQQPLELTTSGGSIKLTVPGEFKMDLSASTSGGNVDCELPVEGAVERDSINGKVNGGGPKVTLRTSSGGIKVAKR